VLEGINKKLTLIVLEPLPSPKGTIPLMHPTLMLFISLLMTSKTTFVTISCFEFCFDYSSTIGNTKTYSQGALNGPSN
jgi:hypothetical protein